jgi:hypothetical protein
MLPQGLNPRIDLALGQPKDKSSTACHPLVHFYGGSNWDSETGDPKDAKFVRVVSRDFLPSFDCVATARP